ncbi:hypothetical protein PIB30_027300 [Stylosanthes scabra]|uniref:Transposase MuDR plant domain-containing protein n=1 Tax=Stylosanthes scabra TaxID=79078 RepID=A0ABU6Y7U2_9FABA|nr:hypothetical protein [Stylosanthes scabra]
MAPNALAPPSQQRQKQTSCHLGKTGATPDDDSGPIPNQQGGASSSGTHQYPPHLSNLNLDALSGPGRPQGEPSSGTQGSQGSNNQAEFEIGHAFVDKEVSVLAVKNYSIRRGVEYRVMESDHAKYLERCKQFGQGCN